MSVLGKGGEVRGGRSLLRSLFAQEASLGGRSGTRAHSYQNKTDLRAEASPAGLTELSRITAVRKPTA